jgi:ADP-ribosylation factor-like protein 1
VYPLPGAPVLIFANKQDLPNALSPEEVFEQSGLAKYVDQREYHIQGCSIIKNEGVYEGLKWLAEILKKRG